MTNLSQPDEVEDVDPSDEDADYQYDLTFYGADYPVDSLVKRLGNKDIVVPTFDPENELVTDVEAFQRKFVWTKLQCDRFVESLLLGLPVPGIFLVQQSNKRLLVLDGQQRLLTLSSFYAGILTKKEFALEHVQTQYKGLTYNTLDEQDRRTLDDSIIHATVIRKAKNAQDLRSVYSLFERLNSGGTQLSPHEIRVALVPGKLMHLVRELNASPAWRALYGAPSKTLKDQELVLRFIAMRFSLANYDSPMKDFLTTYAQSNSDLQAQSAEQIKEAFEPTIALISSTIGKHAFRIKTALNVAVYDAISVAVSQRLAEGPLSDKGLVEAYQNLLSNPAFLASVEKATARKDQVEARMTLACQAFAAAP